MTASPRTPDDAQKRADSRRKRKALLAGGVVLGLGAAATLATWSDDLFAKGSFQTGSFDIVGTKVLNSSTYTDYQQYPSTGPADLSTNATETGMNFRIDSLNLSPGETVVAPFSIATTNDTSAAGRYWLANATVDAGKLAPYLSFSIVQSASCTPEDPSTTATEQTSLANPWKTYHFTKVSESKDFPSVQSSSGTNPDIALSKAFGNQSHLCIGVTLDDSQDAIKTAGANGSAGKTGITWKFTGAAAPLTN